MKPSVNQYIDIMVSMLTSPWLKMGAILMLGMLLGSFLFSNGGHAENAGADQHGKDIHSEWTCSMHPQIKLDEAGQCPICFMDLIPVSSNGSEENTGQVSLSESAVKLAQISTTPVRLGIAQSKVHLSGKIDYDETRVKNISAWFPGRLEHLYVDYTGIRVNKGDHLLEIYSPDLFSTQSELLQAHARMKNSGQSQASMAITKSAYETVREKTKLLGLNNAQVDEIIQQGKARSVLQINSPITGIVTQKNAVEGKYVETGEQIYSIADLSKVWLILEAYEKDLPRLSFGQELKFSVPGLPGQSFAANISYIDPLVNQTKRSITVRAVLDNSSGLLKPGMLAEATISVTLNGSGHVVTPEMAGKWACPMHPEVVENYPGDCSVCGMDLLAIEEISGPSAEDSHALLIPVSAVLKTGKRALAYVEIENNAYELRELILGPRVDQEYIVFSGLSEGELVVSNGNFKIDSAMQIAGKKSMMSGEQSHDKAPSGHQHG